MKRLLDRLRGRTPERPAPRYPQGQRAYAIGDVHGRDDLLETLLEKIIEDAADSDARVQLVYLGDYIDRGAQSRAVVDRILDTRPEGFDFVFLKGNHEQALLDFLEYPLETAAWLGFGGRETLASYGIEASLAPTAEELRALARALDERLPDRHRQFFLQGRSHWRSGDYYFVHAGIRPETPLDRQHIEDQLWIRGEFTESSADHGVVVVHGHVISRTPEFRFNRIGIDTGAFHSGVLTALVLEDASQRVIQAVGQTG